MVRRVGLLRIAGVALSLVVLGGGCGNPARPKPRSASQVKLPALEAEGWVNGTPAAKTLQGKVVVVNAWAHW